MVYKSNFVCTMHMYWFRFRFDSIDSIIRELFSIIFIRHWFAVHILQSQSKHKRAKIDHNFGWVQNFVTSLLCRYCMCLQLIQMMLKWKWNGEFMKNMLDWNSFKCCCSSISLPYSVFHVQRSSVVACLNYGHSICICNTSMWMRICDCVAIYTHWISHSFDMSKRCVCHAYASYTQYQFRMVEKVAQPVSLHAIHSRFTATEQVLGIVITIHSLLLLLPLVLFCYCYFSTSTHTRSILLSIHTFQWT